MVWSLLCHLIWPCQDFLPPLYRLLMILFGSNPLVLMLLGLPLPNLIHRWPSMLTNIFHDISLNVGDLVYVSTEHFPLAR